MKTGIRPVMIVLMFFFCTAFSIAMGFRTDRRADGAVLAVSGPSADLSVSGGAARLRREDGFQSDHKVYSVPTDTPTPEPTPTVIFTPPPTQEPTTVPTAAPTKTPEPEQKKETRSRKSRKLSKNITTKKDSGNKKKSTVSGKKNQTKSSVQSFPSVQAISEDTTSFSEEQYAVLRKTLWSELKETAGNALTQKQNLTYASIYLAIGKETSAMDALVKYGGKAWKKKNWGQAESEVWMPVGDDSAITEEIIKAAAKKLADGMNTNALKEKKWNAGAGFHASVEEGTLYVKAVVVWTD